MSGPNEERHGWRDVDYDTAWTPFQERFEFVPDPSEQDKPAIRLPPGSLVLDLSHLFANPGPRIAAGTNAINSSALRAFVWLTGDDELLALNWNHAACRYSPAAFALSTAPSPRAPGTAFPALDWPVQVFPNGDYYAHMTPDMRWGAFGHPWQQTLSIWGQELVDSLGAELLTWLPKHRHTLRARNRAGKGSCIPGPPRSSRTDGTLITTGPTLHGAIIQA